MLLALCLTAMAGCDREEIQRYQVRRFDEAPPAVHATATTPQRLLGAIVPQGRQSWFFKLMGPVEQVAQQQEAFGTFVESIRLSTSNEQPISWTVPEAWHEHAGSGMRYASFHIGPDSEHPLELTVIRASGSVLENINRWRGQLGLEPVGEDKRGEITTEVALDGATATVVDMTGRGASAQSMHPPFASMQPPGAASVATAPPALRDTAPKDWTKVPNPLGMPLPAYRVTSGDQSASVSVTIVGGSVAANVNRWRSQVGLDPLPEEQLGEQQIELDGATAAYFDLPGPESAGQDRQRILGAIAIRDGRWWFFKMRGPFQLVENQKPAFDVWLRSVQFEPAQPAQGDSDG